MSQLHKITIHILIQKYSKEFYECKNAKYYSNLYVIDLLCIHMILNKKWNEIDITEFLEKIFIGNIYIYIRSTTKKTKRTKS